MPIVWETEAFGLGRGVASCASAGAAAAARAARRAERRVIFISSPSGSTGFYAVRIRCADRNSERSQEVTLLALASPVPGALGAGPAAGSAWGLVCALPRALAGLAFLGSVILRRRGNSIPDPRDPVGRGAAVG